MNKRIQKFLADNKPATPCLVIDLDVVRQNYRAMRRYLPKTEVFYAVKANPAPEVVRVLVEEGSGFDVASLPEIQLCLDLGASPERMSFGNTIKKERDIAYAYSRGIRLFAFDSEEELLKISSAAPGSMVYCRILVENEGAQWPLSRKFGCEPEMAADLLCQAREVGLVPHGVSFHVGSQQLDLSQWDVAMTRVVSLFMTLLERGVELQAIDLGGGLPAHYQEQIEELPAYAEAVMRSVIGHFGMRHPRLMIEPGRSMVGDSGVLQAEVVLVSRKSNDDCKRWVYLDAGRFNGLSETLGEAIAYNITTSRDGDETEPVILAGPTCDSVDVIYEKKEYRMPVGLRAGDLVYFNSCGAYAASVSSVNFNGFEAIKQYCI